MIRWIRSGRLALALVLLVAAPGWAQEDAEPVPPEFEGIEVEVKIYDVNTANIDRPLKIVEFIAPSIERLTKYLVLLPRGYDDTDKRYPVLYLLHGFSQNYTVWPMMNVADYLGDREMIVVMPDAGNSWYVNWAESRDEEVNNWEDYIVYDLVDNVDQSFRTVGSREGRAISGVSMGGYGALTIGLRHPTLYCSVTSHSGALSFARNARRRLEGGAKPELNRVPKPEETEIYDDVSELISIPGFTQQFERYPHGIAFKTVEDCNRYDPFFLITQVPTQVLPHIYLDCGLGDSLIADAREFAQILLKNDVPFTLAQSPGGHGVRYWGRELGLSMAAQYEVVSRNLRFMRQRDEAEAAAAELAEQLEKIADDPSAQGRENSQETAAPPEE